MAKLVKQAQPRLFDYLYQHRSKHKINALIDIAEMTPLVHVSGMFGAARGNTSWVAPLAWHPENKNAVIMCDLAGDMSPLLELDSDTLRERLYTRRDKLQAQESAIPIKLVHINKCPVLAPAKTLLPENADRLGIDRQRCLQIYNCCGKTHRCVKKWSRCLHKLSHSRLPMMWIHSCITAFQ